MRNYKEPLTGSKTIRFSEQLILSILLALLLSGFANAKNPNDEGIKVHGEWLITVSDPDGSVVEERVVHNALASGGAAMLVGLLTASRTMELDANDKPEWDLVAKTSISNVKDCLPNAGAGTAFGTDNVGALNVVIADKAYDAEAFTVVGGFYLPPNCVPNGSYNLTSVQSFFAADDPTGQFASFYSVFSSKTLDSPIQGILPDQHVTLKVTFSFE